MSITPTKSHPSTPSTQLTMDKLFSQLTMDLSELTAQLEKVHIPQSLTFSDKEANPFKHRRTSTGFWSHIGKYSKQETTPTRTETKVSPPHVRQKRKRGLSMTASEPKRIDFKPKPLHVHPFELNPPADQANHPRVANKRFRSGSCLD
jgi:hypothetical protein